MRGMEDIREMLMKELEKYSKKGELSAGSLEIIDKLTHAIKSIDTIMAMEDSGYSNESGYSYARGRGSNARRDSMGRYSRRDGMSYEDGSYARGGRGYGRERGYSRDDAKEDLAMDLKELKMESRDPETSRMIDKWIKQLEQD